MKKIIFILLAATTVVSCKKNNDNTVPVNPVSLENKVKQVISGGTRTYSYDASGRLVQKLYADGGKSQFEYPAGKVIEKEYKTDGSLKEIYTYDLDANGLVGKETWSSNPSYQELRVYNNDKQQIKATTTYNGVISTADYFFSNGNCDSVRFSAPSGWQSTVKRTYYTDKPNVLDYDATGQTWLGHKSKNLIKTEQYFFSNGSFNPAVMYTYEFDAKGRIVKETNEYNGDIDIVYYKY